MTRLHAEPGSWMTRRDVLAQAALGAVAASVSPYLGQAMAVLPQAEAAPRTRDSFDFGWKFFKGDAPGAHLPNFADAAWRDVDLPHDWSIEGQFNESEPSSGNGAYLPTGIGWYRKRFRMPAAVSRPELFFEFDGVYQNSEVWINGQYLGLRPYGFVPFAYELTPYLKFEADNLVAVKVDNSRQTNCRWYSGSGIYRHTWLSPPIRCALLTGEPLSPRPRVSRHPPSSRVRTRVANGRKSPAQCTLTAESSTTSARVVATQESSQTVSAQGEYEFVQQITVDQPSLWEPANPYIYTARSTVRDTGHVVDAYETPSASGRPIFDADRGFPAQRRALKLNGVCLHHEAGCVGAAVPERVWERRLEILKEMGCNAIRTSHNPYAAEFLDLCDRMGFLVMNEAFDEWKVAKGQMPATATTLYFDEWHERDVTNFIHRDRNHPSVVLWSAGNEIPDQVDPQGVGDPARAAARLPPRRSHPPGHRRLRPYCVRADRGPAGVSAPARCGWLQLRGPLARPRQNLLQHRPRRISAAAGIGTESSGMGGVRGDYRGLFPVPPMPAAGNRCSQPMTGGAGRGIDTEQLWKFVGAHDYVCRRFHVDRHRLPGRGRAGRPRHRPRA